MKKVLALVLVCVVGMMTAGIVSAQEDDDVMAKLEKIAVFDQKVMVPMRDGVSLATDIIRPADAEGPVPTIFMRTPYNFNLYRDGEEQTRGLRQALKAVEHGYAMVVQNERGRYFSEGEWDLLGPPKTDGYDALSWIAEQPWSNGKVGTTGCSSSAEWQKTPRWPATSMRSSHRSGTAGTAVRRKRQSSVTATWVTPRSSMKS